MKTIEQIRDKYIEKYVTTAFGCVNDRALARTAMHVMADRLLKRLTEIGMAEFDEESFDAVYQPEYENDEIHEAIERGARWMHEQNAAQIGAMKAKYTEEYHE